MSYGSSGVGAAGVMSQPQCIWLCTREGSTWQTDKSLCGEPVWGMVLDLLKRAYQDVLSPDVVSWGDVHHK